MLMENKSLLKLEESTKKKCAEFDTNFWTDTFEKIIQEFVSDEEQKTKVSKNDFKLECPKVDNFITICEKKLTWTQEYAIEKLLPILSRWQVNTPDKPVIKPVHIVKKRIVHGTHR